MDLFLLRIIAYRIQANAFGDLDRETARYLDRIAKDYQKRRGMLKHPLRCAKWGTSTA